MSSWPPPMFRPDRARRGGQLPWYLLILYHVINPFSFGRVGLVSSCTKSAVFQLWGRLVRPRGTRRWKTIFQKVKLLDMPWCACGQLQRRCVDEGEPQTVATYSAGAGMYVGVPVRTVTQNDVMTPVPGMGGYDVMIFANAVTSCEWQILNETYLQCFLKILGFGFKKGLLKNPKLNFYFYLNPKPKIITNTYFG